MEIEYYDADLAAVLSGLASMALKYAGALAMLVLIIAGIYYATAQGDPDRQKQAKNAFSFAVLGLIIIVISYAVISAIGRAVNG